MLNVTASKPSNSFGLISMSCQFSGGRTIIFTETKESASQLAGSLPGARALHGDIQQSQREVINNLTTLPCSLFEFCCRRGLFMRGLLLDCVALLS